MPPDLIRGRVPVRRKKARQGSTPEDRFRFNRKRSFRRADFPVELQIRSARQEPEGPARSRRDQARPARPAAMLQLMLIKDFSFSGFGSSCMSTVCRITKMAIRRMFIFVMRQTVDMQLTKMAIRRMF